MLIIYGLRDPISGHIRYIGKSKRGMSRAKAHARQAARGAVGHKANWIRSLQSRGALYEIVVLEEVSSENALNASEIAWIARLRCFGHLTNVSDGGPDEDQAAAGRARWQGMSDEERSEAARARWRKFSPEERRNHAKLANEATSDEEKSAKTRAQMAKLSQDERKRLADHARSFVTEDSRKRRGISFSATIFATTTQDERRTRATHAAKVGRAKIAAAAKRRWADMSVEERSREMRQRWAKISPERRSAQALKAWETRRRIQSGHIAAEKAP
jgi:hypothetical protein